MIMIKMVLNLFVYNNYLFQEDLRTQPYIKPYGPSFDRTELPYFKYRETIRLTQIKARQQEEVRS